MGGWAEGKVLGAFVKAASAVRGWAGRAQRAFNRITVCAGCLLVLLMTAGDVCPGYRSSANALFAPGCADSGGSAPILFILNERTLLTDSGRNRGYIYPPRIRSLPIGSSTDIPRPQPEPELVMEYPVLNVGVRETSYRDYIISCGSRDVAITFDDGPSEKTPELLRVLSEEGVKATFFVLGNRVQVFQDYARQIVSEGHEIANHSWSHFKLDDGSQTGYGINQFLYAEKVIREVTGVSGLLLLRIPYGKVYSFLILTMGREGYRFVTWTIDTKDWAYQSEQHTLDACSEAVPGDIILLHDQGTSPEGLRAIIRILKEKRLECVTVSQMMDMEMPGIPQGAPVIAPSD